ncbi:DUF421 domain-containing protein [Alkalihalobacillus pseudalcaliphilus]|uniref:DUF421 domain-containing protein n=1 Tax=Alkalihalobacillus pseudalcaliphilus TaxID=79884 RepID=UPI00064DAFDC|nr:DUF421 domain-containing protein [Alkalihalobacillus pseudalcaliphilus]KMK76575.1 hypothetical protein AB990_15530 [Alkalihalobacillus pseudalcaliphilus]
MFEFWVGAEELPIYGFLIRGIIIYLYIFFFVKVLGQRSMSSIDPLDFIFGVVIGDILGAPLTDGDLSMTGPVCSAAVIASLHFALSLIALKTPRFRRVIEEEPIILIQHGKILNKQLKKTRVTIEQLMMDLRLKDASNLNEVDYAILELNGQISVIKKNAFQALTPQDIGKTPSRSGYPSVLIEDGEVVIENVQKMGTVEQIRLLINKYGYEHVEDIFLMIWHENGEVYISPKQKQT